MISIIHLQAKHDDRFSITFNKDNGDMVEHDGYAPSITGLCRGDYTSLRIDNATGTIVGWVPITDDELEEILKQ